MKSYGQILANNISQLADANKDSKKENNNLISQTPKAQTGSTEKAKAIDNYRQYLLSGGN